MTSAQKILVTASLTIVFGAGVYEAYKAWGLSAQWAMVRRHLEPELQRLEAAGRERDRTLAQLQVAKQQLEQLRHDLQEAGRLRLEVSALRAQVHALPPARAVESGTHASNLSLAERVSLLKRQLSQTPERRIPELQLADDNDWLEAAAGLKTDNETELRNALSHLRLLAKDKLAPSFGAALRDYLQAHDGVLPGDIMELKPYFDPPIDEAILQRYQVAGGKRLSDLKPGQNAIQEKSRVDESDTLLGVSTDHYLHLSPPQIVPGTGGTAVRAEVQSFSLPTGAKAPAR